MLLKIQEDILLELICLKDILRDWVGLIGQSFNEQKEGERAEILESSLGSLLALKTNLNSEVDRLIEKVEKEIAREKKAKSMTVKEIDNPMT
jgi:hypothetical protein